MHAPTTQISAHRFRTYLATIVSSVELMQHYASQVSSAERENLVAEIGAAAQRMREMLDEAALAQAAQSPARALVAANEPCHG